MPNNPVPIIGNFLNFLGENTKPWFKAPEAMHHARWMSKAIYSLKIFLFRNEFEFTKKEEKALCEIFIFLIKIYADAWFTSPLPIKAPFCDFNFLIKQRKIYFVSRHSKCSLASQIRTI